MISMIAFRPATQDDARFLFDLRNDPVVRKFSISTRRRIRWKAHLAWFQERLRDPLYLLWIVLDSGGTPIGTAMAKRLLPSVSEIGVRLIESARGQGFGRAVVHMLCELDTCLYAHIAEGNIASMQCFINEGFKFFGYESEHAPRYYILKKVVQR